MMKVNRIEPSSGRYYICEDTVVILPLSNLVSLAVVTLFNPALQQPEGGLILAGGYYNYRRRPYRMEKLQRICQLNPLRRKANGRRVLNIPIVMYCDDMSTRRWNKHESWYFTLAGLPFKEVNKEYNVHFIGTSNTIGGMEMLPETVDELM